MLKPMKKLSLAQAQACENALNARCRCRCRGALHGAKRGGDGVPERKFFEALPQDDPHYLKPDKKKKDETAWVVTPLFGALHVGTSTQEKVKDVWSRWMSANVSKSRRANADLADTSSTATEIIRQPSLF